MRAGQHLRLESLRRFDEFLERRFQAAATLGDGYAEDYLRQLAESGPELMDQWSDLRSEAAAITGANFRIGDMYADGNGVPKDASEAERWYQHGVDMASAGEAMYWYRKAADRGSAVAEWMIVDCILTVKE